MGKTSSGGDHSKFLKAIDNNHPTRNYDVKNYGIIMKGDFSLYYKRPIA